MEVMAFDHCLAKACRPLCQRLKSNYLVQSVVGTNHSAAIRDALALSITSAQPSASSPPGNLIVENMSTFRSDGTIKRSACNKWRDMHPSKGRDDSKNTKKSRL